MSDFIEPEQEHSFYNAEEPVYFVPRNEETGLKKLGQRLNSNSIMLHLILKKYNRKYRKYLKEVHSK